VGRWAASFAARFALLYAGLLVIAAQFPVYLWLEHALVWLVQATLPSAGAVQRQLWLEAGSGAPLYRYDVALGGLRELLGGPIHLHGFVPLVTVALVLATPRLGPARRAGYAAAAAGLAMLLAAGMLMSDLQGWERAAFPGSRGPYPRAIALFEGLHRTAGAGLIPLVLWSFFASRLARA
jgi:hypothetical protein